MKENNFMKKKTPKITVIINSFNHGKFIKQAIDSVLNQSFKDFELIIWDDASPDNSWEIINSFNDQRIHSYRNLHNTNGVNLVDNVIKNYAKGEYIAILHSDDYWHTDKLKLQYEFLSKNKDYGACYTWANIIDNDGNNINDSDPLFNIFRQPNRPSYEWIRFFFENGNAICHPSNLVRRKCYEQVGFYQAYPHRQLGDLKFHIKFCFKFNIHVISQPLVYFRRLKSKSNMSASSYENQNRSFLEFFKLNDVYKERLNFKNIFNIFPEYQRFNIGNETIVEFVFARICIDSESYQARIYGLSLLFDLFKKNTLDLNKKYNFNLIDFMDLTGKSNIFSDAHTFLIEKETAIAEKDALTAEKDALTAELSQLLNSSSWKITKPLRWIKKLLSNFNF